MTDTPSPQDEKEGTHSEVWRTYLTTGAAVKDMQIPWFEHPFFKPIFRALPSELRCQICYIPFKGVGGFISKRLLDVKPSKLNPHMCDLCERFAERFPGGAGLEISILFADIRGSTPLAERMEPGAFSELIRRFYLAGIRALYSNNSLIEKFSGDGLTAFFAPAFAGSNHARTAVQAAQDLLKATGHGPGKTPCIPVGVGVGTGLAYVGSMEMEGGHPDITILGDIVNTMARLCSQAAAGEILVGARAIEMSGLPAQDYEHRILTLKGKTDTVDAWSIPAS